MNVQCKRRYRKPLFERCAGHGNGDAYGNVVIRRLGNKLVDIYGNWVYEIRDDRIYDTYGN